MKREPSEPLARRDKPAGDSPVLRFAVLATAGAVALSAQRSATDRRCKPTPTPGIDCTKGMSDDDRELLERIQRGEAESLGVLYDRTHRWLLNCVIVPRVGRTDADDVLAETFRTALAKIGSFRWRGVALLHWLATIARRKALEHGRRTRSRTEPLDDLPDLLELPDNVPTAEAEMIRAEHVQGLRDRVASVLAELPERYAEALRLRLLENRTRPECAERFAVSTATFDVVLYRATRAFAREWRKYESA